VLSGVWSRGMVWVWSGGVVCELTCAGVDHECICRLDGVGDVSVRPNVQVGGSEGLGQRRSHLRGLRDTQRGHIKAKARCVVVDISDFRKHLHKHTNTQ